MDIVPLKRCRKCQQEFPATTSYFHARKKYPDGLERACKECLAIASGRPYRHPELLPDGCQRCTKCLEVKSLDGFHLKKGAQRGYRRYCKDCHAAYCRERYLMDVEGNRAYRRAWYWNNPEPVKAKVRQWNLENQERRREYSIQWRAANPDRKRQNDARWRRSNPDKINQHSRNARARKRNAPGTHTFADVELQLQSQRGLCWWCNKKLDPDNYHVDHRIPISRGGSNDARNICCTCAFCNLSKNDKLPHEWNGRLL